MYTNIDKDNAFLVFKEFFRYSTLCQSSQCNSILSALKNIINHNYFKFGNTIWKQYSGVVMGAPPSCCIAMSYYFIHEANQLLPSFSTEIRFYSRYIDDVFGIWYHGSNPTLDKARWKAFK